jgi:hypothetical protein
MNPDTSTVDPILNLIPEGYKGLVLAVFILAPIFGRAYHAIVSGGGLKGIWTALMFGTNAPKILIASLCLLTVAACTSAERDAALVEVKASGKRVLSTTAKAAEDAALAEVRRLTSAKQPVNVTP